MDTRSPFKSAELFNCMLCVYCGSPAATNDHAPPKCLLRPPLPSNLITLPSCRRCNSRFSFDEGVTRTILIEVCNHPDLASERGPDGRSTRALARDARLRKIIDDCRRPDGRLELRGHAFDSFTRIMRKTTLGLYFGVYEQVLDLDHLEVLTIVDQRQETREQMIGSIRPSGFVDITDEPLPTLTSSAWMTREPVFVMEMQPVGGGAPVQRMFRMVRETLVDWVPLQPDIFTFGFVQHHRDGRAVCVLDLWGTLLVAIAAPWPSSRGPLRKGKKNPFSRE